MTSQAADREDILAQDEEAMLFSPVSTSKFVLLSLLTFGLYQLLWLYRNWRFLKRTERPKIWPWARTLFAPIWYYSLLKRLGVSGAVGLTIAFWLILAAARLPDPFWLLSLLAFLPLLPAVHAVNAMNRDPGTHRSYSWRKRSTVVGTLGLMITPLAVAGTFGPATSVVSGSAMNVRDIAFLSDSNLLLEGEEILYFYSAGFFSIRGNGVFASDIGITSYWVDPVSEELTTAFLPYGDIVDIEIRYSDTILEDTAVRVEGRDNSWFLFFLSTEGGGDRRFLEEVERRRSSAAAATSDVLL